MTPTRTSRAGGRFRFRFAGSKLITDAKLGAYWDGRNAIRIFLFSRRFTLRWSFRIRCQRCYQPAMLTCLCFPERGEPWGKETPRDIRALAITIYIAAFGGKK